MTDRVRPVDLVLAIAETLHQVHHQELPEVCERYGLEPGKPSEAYDGKKWYVRRRIKSWELHRLVVLGGRVLDDFRSEELEELMRRCGTRGVAGDFKNLIFAANGPKPEIVLRDAVNNQVEIVKNAQFCLVYDRVLPNEGLSWAALVSWWSESQGRPTDDLVHPGRLLYARLAEALDPNSPPEQLFFKEYCALYGTHPIDKIPALIPQVYLHYDPYTARERRAPGPLPRQRMDFLLLLPQNQRVVIEIDGKQHYCDDEGRPSPRKYAEMMAEDRRLRLAGYEVFRFGAAELAADPHSSSTTVRAFITELFLRYHLRL
ncbi:hypothetical protein [Micromonospora sp. RL09-050-HVF-A]|uniref:hypothetical protein n=1 Tax=Micromonospora sp. RL09-050-HVF-A TaxID=1703433 RepID=UPI001C5D11CF|nr:hypothetical protein [Micromonospora sp. RL09-050-HVF-A]MBW4705172.1 hypothetical protein [Micromonospora sp. RL09-050-HVF-A]